MTEKGLGGIYKSGKSPIVGTLRYAESPTKAGLYVMNAPSQDAEVCTSFAAAGAQIIVFTTGRGTPTGFPGVPVLKVTGNNRTYITMSDDIDINAGLVMEGEVTLEQCGEAIYEELIAVVNGKRTKAEALGHDELFAIGRYEIY